MCGIALAVTDPLDENARKRTRRLGSKKAWREAEAAERKKEAEGDTSATSFVDVAQERSKNAREVLSNRYKNATHKGERFQVKEPATVDDIDAVLDVLDAVFPTNKPHRNENLSKAQLFRDPEFAAFAADHMQAHQYSFQVKKCGKQECAHCKAVRSPSFGSLCWMPTPTPAAAGERYKSFDETYGDVPTDDHVPSLRDKEARIVLPTPPFSCISQYARRLLVCGDCNKPRILYSQRKLTESQTSSLDAHLDDFKYICGKPLFPEGHSLDGIVFQQRQTRCRVAISAQYYRASNIMGLEGWKWVCGVDGCHDASEAAIEDDDYSHLPRCAACKEAGREAPKARSNTRSVARPRQTVTAPASSAAEEGGEGAAVTEAAAEDVDGDASAGGIDDGAATIAIAEADSDENVTGRGDDAVEEGNNSADGASEGNISSAGASSDGGASDADEAGAANLAIADTLKRRASSRNAQMPERFRRDDSSSDDGGRSAGPRKRRRR